MEKTELPKDNALTDEIETMLETRLREDLDDFLADSTEDDFLWHGSFEARTPQFVRVGNDVWKSHSFKAICAVSLSLLVCFAAWFYFAPNMTDRSNDVPTTRNTESFGIMGDPAVLPNDNSRSTSTSTFWMDVLTVVDFEDSSRNEKAEEKWQSLVRLSERGVCALPGKLVDYSPVQASSSLGAPLKLLTAIQTDQTNSPTLEVDRQETPRSFDDALFACVDSFNDVSVIWRCDPCRWVVEKVLDDD